MITTDIHRQWPHDAKLFFDDFVAAFSSLDGTLIAQRYQAPYVSANATGELRVFADQGAIAEYFCTVLAGYRQQGCTACSYDHLQIVPMGANAALATVCWRLFNHAGQQLGCWTESYNLLRLAQGLRIFASTDHA
jgi:hypothetical protein